jgi:hypothetical protein
MSVPYPCQDAAQGAIHRILDLNGDNHDDVLIFSKDGKYLLAFSQWDGMRRLAGVTNINGGITRPAYANLRQVTKLTARPKFCDAAKDTDWRENCGVPVNSDPSVVTRVSAWSGRDDHPQHPDESTEYDYADERAYPAASPDGVWAGFGQMVERDLQSQTVTERYFYQDRVFAGRPRLVREFAASNDLLSEEITKYTDTRPTANTSQILLANTQKVALVNGKPYAMFTKTFVFDAYGYEKTIEDCSGLVTNDLRECVTTTNEYEHDTTNWRLGRLKSTKRVISQRADHEALGTVISWKQFKYLIGGEFDGLLKSRSELDCDNAQRCKDNADFKFIPMYTIQSYDRFGNVTNALDAKRASTVTTYEPAFPFSVRSERNALGEETDYT